MGAGLTSPLVLTINPSATGIRLSTTTAPYKFFASLITGRTVASSLTPFAGAIPGPSIAGDPRPVFRAGGDLLALSSCLRPAHNAAIPAQISHLMVG